MTYHDILIGMLIVYVVYLNQKIKRQRKATLHATMLLLKKSTTDITASLADVVATQLDDIHDMVTAYLVELRKDLEAKEK